MKKIFNLKTIITFILGGIFFSCISVYAATVILSKDVTYDNKNSKTDASDVQGAIDELFDKVKGGSCSVTKTKFYTLYGAKNEKITINDELEVTTDANGEAIVQLFANTDYKMTGSISGYTVVNTTAEDNLELYVRPRNILYWFGSFGELGSWTINNYYENGNYYNTALTTSYNTNNFYWATNGTSVYVSAKYFQFNKAIPVSTIKQINSITSDGRSMSLSTRFGNQPTNTENGTNPYFVGSFSCQSKTVGPGTQKLCDVSYTGSASAYLSIALGGGYNTPASGYVYALWYELK